jgi:hypothetical protein
VAVIDLVLKDTGGYMSKTITPENANDAGVFETFRYTANLPAGRSGTIKILDANTGELLAETALQGGTNEWSLASAFRIREHASINVMVVTSGLDPQAGNQFSLDDLWLNWSPRNRAIPQVLSMDLSSTEVYRTQSLDMSINVTDEYDFPHELIVNVEHRLSGTTDPWTTYMVGGLGYKDDMWQALLNPRVDIELGAYDLRVMATDGDGMESGWKVYTEAFTVLNNVPTAPEVVVTPARPVTTSTLIAEVTTSAMDVESTLLTYRYEWYLDGVLVPNLTTEMVSSTWISRGQNWSVEVSAWDGDEHGPPGVAFRVIQNAGPGVAEHLPDPQFEEDTVDSNWLLLATAFEDPDGDDLTWRVDPPPDHLGIEIDPATGRVTITPDVNWHGEETIIIWASDGEFEVNQTVTVIVTPVNDAPRILTINGQPYTGGPIGLTVDQGKELEILIAANDVEGDDLLYRVDTTRVVLDLTTGRINFTPSNDDVGWINFSLSLSDNVNPSVKEFVEFNVEIMNTNDIMDDPRIISPIDGDSFKWNVSVGLRSVCIDPDEQYGQVLNFSWSSNASGHLGYGNNINFRFLDSGLHNITLTVTDGEFTKRVHIELSVGAEPLPPPPPKKDDDEGGLSMAMIAIIIAAVLAVLVVFLIMSKRKQAEMEDVVPVAIAERQAKRKALEDFAESVKMTADQMEEELDEMRHREPEIEVAGTGMVPSAGSSHRMKLSEQASDETQKLWADMAKEESVVDDAEKEALRIDNEKRKVQSAIQALPYGIPAQALRNIQPHMLAEEIVKGKRHELPDGRVLVAVRGKWYHGDHEDSSTFLMPYKEATKAAEPAKPTTSEWEEE